MEGLRGILEVSWRRLGASWTCLGENIEKRSRGIHFWESSGSQNGGTNHLHSCLKSKLLFVAFSNIFFVIFHVFESQLVKTCTYNLGDTRLCVTYTLCDALPSRRCAAYAAYP